MFAPRINPRKMLPLSKCLPSLAIKFKLPWSDLLKTGLKLFMTANSVRNTLEALLLAIQCALMVGHAQNRSETFTGSGFKADSSQSSSEYFQMQPNSGFEMPECGTMLRSTNDARNMLPSSNMSAITRPQPGRGYCAVTQVTLVTSARVPGRVFFSC